MPQAPADRARGGLPPRARATTRGATRASTGNAATGTPGVVPRGLRRGRRSSKQPKLRVRRLVLADHVRGNAAALAHREPICHRPGTDLRAVLTVRCRSPLCPHHSARCLTGVRCKAADGLVEPFAVLQAKVDLVVTAVDAEPAQPVLARRNLFLVVVTRVSDRNFLCHSWPPLPLVPNISSLRRLNRNDTQVNTAKGTAEAVLGTLCVMI